MGLFGKKTRPTFTNAPPHWPKLTLENWVPENPALAYLDRLYEDEVLRLPLVGEEAERQTAVFAYPKADADTPALLSGARALVREREHGGHTRERVLLPAMILPCDARRAHR